MKKITIIFAGTPEFACPSLEALIKDERFSVVAVISQTDKPVGRNQEIKATPVKELALKYGIKVYQPEKIQNIEKELKSISHDFLVVIAYGQIIPMSILNIAKWNINLHGSLLPKYRGATPIQSALLNGDEETGISIMEMNEKMDAGPVYRQFKISIYKDDNAQILFQKLSDLGVYLPEELYEIANGFKPKPQDEKNATYCKKINKTDGEIDFKKESAIHIWNKMRAFINWPGVFFYHNNKRIKILSGSVSEVDDRSLKPGAIDINKGIKTCSGYFLPEKVLPEGKKEQTYKQWAMNN